MPARRVEMARSKAAGFGIYTLGVFAALGAASAARATTGVALFAKNFVIVAADGRVNEVGPKLEFHRSQCKISTAKGRVAVVSGLTEEQGVNFDARRIVSAAMQESDSVYGASDLAARAIRRELPAALAGFKEQRPNDFAAMAAGAIQILMAGINSQGEVQVARRSIPYDGSRPIEVENTSAAVGQIRIAAIGESSAIDQEVDRLQRAGAWRGSGNPKRLESTALRLVALEIVAKPYRVGPPVSVVLVRPDGIHWEQAGACRERQGL